MTKEKLHKWEIENVIRPELMEETGNNVEAVEKHIDALNKQFAKEAAAEAADKTKENLDVKIDFYEQFAEKLGHTTKAAEFQKVDIQAMGEAWLKAGIPMQDVLLLQERLYLEASRSPWAGLSLEVDSYYTNATDWAENFGDLYTSSMDMMTQATTDFVMTGKFNFADLANSFIRMLIEMQMRAAASSVGKALFGGLTSMVGGLFGGGIGSISGGATSGYAGGGMNSLVGAIVRHDGGMAGDVGVQRLAPLSVFTNAPRGAWHGITISNPCMEGTSIIATGSVLDWIFRPFGRLYLPSNYPALVRGR